MTELLEENESQPIVPTWVIIGTLAALLMVGWLIFGSDARPLKPFRPTVTPGELYLNSQPSIVTFEQLNADPVSFRDQRIRITGSYSPLPKPECFEFSGPVIYWSLVNDEYLLNGLGFEQILKLAPNGTTLTVEGIWRLYQGPFGCGKGPTREQVWYLHIEQIIQPNPLPNIGTFTGVVGTEAEPTPTSDILPSPDNEETAVPTSTIQFTPTGQSTITPIPTATATFPAGTTITATPTPTTTNGRPTEQPNSSATPTITLTPPGGSATATPIVPTNSTNTPAATSPPLASATPGPSPTPGSGYPGPTSPPPTSSIPSPTPDPYD